MPGLGGDLAPLLLTLCKVPGGVKKSRGLLRKSHESGCRVHLDAGNAFHAMEAMAKAKPVQAPAEVGAPSFSKMLSQAVDKVNETQQASTA